VNATGGPNGKQTMMDHEARVRRNLVVRVQTRVCALPLMHVVEAMRPLPLESIAGMPPFVRGVSVIRGIPTPVVDLGAVLGTLGGTAERIVTLRMGDRHVALCVDAVLGICDLDPSAIQELPPLLRGASTDVIEAIGTLDERFLMVLRTGWELPDDVWQALAARQLAS
jgi:purine-binding chemotaxis protein CheW